MSQKIGAALPSALSEQELANTSGGAGERAIGDINTHADAAPRVAARLRQLQTAARLRQLLELRAAPIGLGCPRGHQRDGKATPARAQRASDRALLQAALRAAQ